MLIIDREAPEWSMPEYNETGRQYVYMIMQHRAPDIKIGLHNRKLIELWRRYKCYHSGFKAYIVRVMDSRTVEKAIHTALKSRELHITHELFVASAETKEVFKHISRVYDIDDKMEMKYVGSCVRQYHNTNDNREQERHDKEKREQERRDKEKREQERHDKEKREQERRDKEKREQERRDKEKREQERREQERREQEQREQERIKFREGLREHLDSGMDKWNRVVKQSTDDNSTRVTVAETDDTNTTWCHKPDSPPIVIIPVDIALEHRKLARKLLVKTGKDYHQIPYRYIFKALMYKLDNTVDYISVKEEFEGEIQLNDDGISCVIGYKFNNGQLMDIFKNVIVSAPGETLYDVEWQEVLDFTDIYIGKLLPPGSTMEYATDATVVHNAKINHELVERVSTRYLSTFI